MTSQAPLSPVHHDTHSLPTTSQHASPSTDAPVVSHCSATDDIQAICDLDELLSRIGFGRFQQRILVLCGLGWFADNANSWCACIATILPRVQEHFDVPTKTVGLMSSCVFIGMMLGALFWGLLSDRWGRKLAFNATMVIGAVFGMASAFSPSFPVLCVLLLLVGFGVGGNMPVDGALFLEFMPRENQYLLTTLSIFFSLGAAFSSGIAWGILPPYSCPDPAKQPADAPPIVCEPSRENNGWRYLLFLLGAVNLAMFLARILLFRLQETPKYLLAHGKHQETVQVLRVIAQVNRSSVEVTLDDLPVQYTPITAEKTSEADAKSGGSPDEDGVLDGNSGADDLTRMRASPTERLRRLFSLDALRPLFSQALIRTTLLIWAIWVFVALSYTMFNVFLPKFLESRGVGTTQPPREQVYRDYFIYSAVGFPGSILGGWMAETQLGRRGSMIVSTLGTAACMFVFVGVSSDAGTLASTCAISLLSTVMYAVIYSYTPEVFHARFRGSACGIASALGRLVSIVAPLLTGVLLEQSVSLPLYVSAAGFAITGICMALLPIETRGRAN
ncbi:major facilitator superfamily domain-containing protein [Thamnocephalis sphaerospora]|uniref:Major facilitator superfamily domain-containing protein n=1 Tax=Thamnocephalis sphaerospora TaxID=78915 RepID=A0A4P9XNC8_9FUNG|nr:major facilitator superfamily domain-containing protein [Thamnocephalis sphaerospora]|eukprot:RKP07436.1 major facilitator superfamily domain-containing protein [Thamnocephalis sphaerospora]